MPWLPGSSDPGKGKDGKKQGVSWADSLNATDWDQFKDPKLWVHSILLTATGIASLHFYRTYLRRVPGTLHIQPSAFRKRSLLGKVTSVGDGDNFHLFHTPGGRLAGWGWLRKVPSSKAELKGRTIPIRIAGIDAPEGAHFGRPAQPFSGEALAWLTNYILNRRVRAYIWKRDQYDRVVATVYVRRFFIKRDVGLQMLKQGLATTYEAKTGAEFGGLEAEYKAAEAKAKRKRRGIWGAKPQDFESPRAYKTRMAELSGAQSGNETANKG